jgi:hypothetical protein
MHPQPSDQLARQHIDDLVSSARRARLARKAGTGPGGLRVLLQLVIHPASGRSIRAI